MSPYLVLLEKREKRRERETYGQYFYKHRKKGTYYDLSLMHSRYFNIHLTRKFISHLHYIDTRTDT